MRRFFTFGMGMVVGALMLWGALQFHLLRTKNGFHFVAKVDASLAKTYVDIRGFTVADWAQNTDLMLALTRANQRDLIENAAEDALQNGMDRLLNRNNAR